jgi:hypothetical protein
MSHQMNLKASSKVFTLALGLTLGLSGCLRPEARNPLAAPDVSGEQAAFNVTQVRGESTSTAHFPGFSIPSAKRYRFTACVRHRITREPLVHQEFEVRGKESSVAARSLEDGCLTWSEDLPFSFLSDEAYLRMERVLVSQAFGQRKIRLAVNPWGLSAGQEVVDLDRSETSPLSAAEILSDDEAHNRLRGLNAQGQPLRRNLWINEMRLRFDQNPGVAVGTDLDMTFEMAPKVVLRNRRGESALHVLTEGQFRMTAYLVANTGSSSQRGQVVLARMADPRVMTLRGGRWTGEMSFHIRFRPVVGQVDLVLRVSPVNGPDQLHPFEGVFKLGDFRAITGASWPILRPALENSTQANFNIEDYVASAIDISAATSESEAAELFKRAQEKAGAPVAAPQQLPSASGNGGEPPLGPQLPSGIVRTRPFEIRHIRIQHTGVEPGTETPTRRTVTFRAATCVENPSTARVLVEGVRFKITRTDNSIVEVATDFEGCVYWRERLTHRFYEKQRYFVRQVKISHESGFEETFMLAVNPWDDGFTFGGDARARVTDMSWEQMKNVRNTNVDMRNAQVRDLLERTGQAPALIDEKMTLRFAEFTIQRFSPEFRLDQDLGFKVANTYQINMTPMLNRYSIRDGENDTEFLRRGIWYLKVAIQKNYPETTQTQGEFISWAKMPICIETGRINPVFEVVFNDWRMLNIRLNVLFEIIPLDNTKLPTVDCKKMEQLAGVDLEPFIERESGFPEMAFIATLADNKGSSVITANELNVFRCNSDTSCKPEEIARLEQIRAQNPGLHKMAGDLMHLKNTRVEDLITRWRAQQEERRRQRAGLDGMAPAAAALNVDYIPLGRGSSDAMVRREPRLTQQNIIMRDRPALDSFVERLNSRTAALGSVSPALRRSVPLEADHVRRALSGQTEISRNFANRLCAFFMLDAMTAMGKDGKPVLLSDPSLNLEWCLVQLGRTRANDLFRLEQQVRVVEFDPAVRFLSGAPTLSLNVGSGFSMDRSRGFSTSIGLSFDPFAFLSIKPLGAGAGAFTAGQASFSKFQSAVGMGVLQRPLGFLSNTGIGLGLNMGTSWSQGVSRGFSVGTGTNLRVERIPLHIKIKKMETCSVLRMSPEFWVGMPLLRERSLNPSMSPDERVRALGRGLAFCSGEVTLKEPYEHIENYFFMSQDIGGNRIAIEDDPRNHLWLLSFRGTSDFMRFVGAVGGMNRSVFDVPKEIDIVQMPVDQLRSAVLTMAPTLPGFIRLDEIPASLLTELQGEASR